MRRWGSRGISRTIILFISLVVIGVAIVSLYIINENKHSLYISHESGIYGEAFELTVRPVWDGVVYYTEDGSVPIEGSPTTKVLEGNLPINFPGGEGAGSYQFCCVFADGHKSEVYRRDFIVGIGGSSRFTTKYVVSVTGDEEALFGYEEGLFVRGRQFDEYMEANPDVDVCNTVIPANYFSDREVGVHAAIFLPDGTQIIDQNCGLKIYGNVTRAKNQKSFRLIARTDYDDLNEFNYPFFSQLLTAEGLTPIDDFQRLSFHNAGNDNGYAFMRTELIGELARRAGFADVLLGESAVVFVNGRYQGVYWLNNTFDDRYFREKYGKYNGEFVVCEGALNRMLTENADTGQELLCAGEYNEFCNWAEQADLNVPANWQRVQDTIDVENFVKYMAIEYYVGNIDWPHNNVKVYRYEPLPGEECIEGTVFDGRYRYLLYDTDYGMGLKFLGWFGNSAEDRTLYDLCNTNEHTGLFRSLLQREDFRTLFINEVLNLQNISFARKNVEDALTTLHASRHQELRYMMEETDVLKDSLWEDDDNDFRKVADEMAVILNFSDVRPATVTDEMQELWECGDAVTMHLDMAGVDGIRINGTLIWPNTEDGIYTGTYFGNVPLTLEYKITPGIIVDGYEINGEYQEGATFTLLPDEWTASDNSLSIRVVFHTEEQESLVIDRFRIQGEQDYIVLQNNGTVAVLLSEYSVVDNYDDLGKGQLPYLYLSPGEEFIVYGKKYAGEQVEYSMQVPYAWLDTEPVLLAHSTRGIVDKKNTD